MKTETYANLTEPAYNHILNMILNSQLKPGDKVPEVAIAEELGISRTPVRNALKQLENEGIVVIHPNRFVQVATYDEEKIQNLGTMRVALDTMAVRLAIFHGSNKDFCELRSIAEQSVHTDDDNRLERIHSDFQFHLHICKIARNPVLEKYQYQLLRQMEVMLSYRYLGAVANPITHDMIVDAIEKRDEKLAVRLIVNHLVEFYKLKEPFPFLEKDPDLF